MQVSSIRSELFLPLQVGTSASRVFWDHVPSHIAAYQSREHSSHQRPEKVYPLSSGRLTRGILFPLEIDMPVTLFPAAHTGSNYLTGIVHGEDYLVNNHDYARQKRLEKHSEIMGVEAALASMHSNRHHCPLVSLAPRSFHAPPQDCTSVVGTWYRSYGTSLLVRANPPT